MRLSLLALIHGSLFLILSACGSPVVSSLNGVGSSIDRCSELIGTCDYYQCVEDERLSCGDTGYPIGYGKRYCEILSGINYPQSKSDLAKAIHPADGNIWKSDVRTCLQVEMDKYFASHDNPSCAELRGFAFDSHPRCYTQKTSFCDLNPAAIVAVGLHIAPKDLLTQESQQQVRDTAKICVEQMNSRLESEKGFRLKLELIKYRSLWQAVALSPSKLPDWLDRFLKTGEESVSP